jgi:S1-C subfamily serine protease
MEKHMRSFRRATLPIVLVALSGCVQHAGTRATGETAAGSSAAPISLATGFTSDLPAADPRTIQTTTLTASAFTASSVSAQLATLARRPVIHVARRHEFLAKVAEVDERTAALLRMDGPRGLVLLDVSAKGAAASGGLKPGDVILGFNGTPVSAVADLTRQLETIPRGERAQVSIWRNEEERSLLIRL